MDDSVLVSRLEAHVQRRAAVLSNRDGSKPFVLPTLLRSGRVTGAVGRPHEAVKGSLQEPLN